MNTLFQSPSPLYLCKQAKAGLLILFSLCILQPPLHLQAQQSATPWAPVYPTQVKKRLSPKKRAQLANWAVQEGKERRKALVRSCLKLDTLEVGYVCIGGGFAAQNVLANAPREIRSHTLIVDGGQPGILQGSSDVGQGWDIVFTGHKPLNDPQLAKVWSTPADFRTKEDTSLNATRKSLAYTRSLNEIVLGVPVLPGKAQVINYSNQGAVIECTLGAEYSRGGTKKVMVKALKGVVITAGLGQPRKLKTSGSNPQISPEDAEKLSKRAPTGLPYLFNDWQLFKSLGESSKPNFKGKTLIVIGSGAAAASAISDLLNEKYLSLQNRPEKIYVIGRIASLDDPGGFAPALYSRARLAAKCSCFSPRELSLKEDNQSPTGHQDSTRTYYLDDLFTERKSAAGLKAQKELMRKRKIRCAGPDYTDSKGYQLDYRNLEYVLTTSSRETKVILKHLGHEEAPKDSFSIVVEVKNGKDTYLLEGDAVMTAIGNTSVIENLFKGPAVEFAPLGCGADGTMPCTLEGVTPKALDQFTLDTNGAPVALISSQPGQIPFLITGASTIGFNTLTREIKDQWRKMVNAYVQTLQEDYATWKWGAGANVNAAALLSQGWLTMKAGQFLASWYDEGMNLPPSRFYFPYPRED